MGAQKKHVNNKALLTALIVVITLALIAAFFYTFSINKTSNTTIPLASYSKNEIELPIDMEVTIHDTEALKELSKVKNRIHANILNGEIILDSTLKTISYTAEGNRQPMDFRDGKIHTIGGEGGEGFLSFKPFTSIISSNEDGTTSELKVYDSAEIDMHELVTDSDGNYWFIRYSLYPCETAIEWCGGTQKPAEVTRFASCVITQVDTKGKMLYNWDAINHIPVSELRKSKWSESKIEGFYARQNVGGAKHTADPLHCNAIDVSEDGKHFLVTMRHTDSVYKIQKSDNEVEWKIGGNNWEGKSLKILPEGEYNSENLISGPHDARFEPGNLISILDNSTNIARTARGFVLDVNSTNKTANVNLELADPANESSNCKGSFRSIAESGYWIAGWGCSPNAATIFDSKGNPVISISPVNSKKNQKAFLEHWGSQAIADILNQSVTYRFTVDPDAKP